MVFTMVVLVLGHDDDDYDDDEGDDKVLIEKLI